MGLAKLEAALNIGSWGTGHLRVNQVNHYMTHHGLMYEVGYLWTSLANGNDAELYMANVFLRDFHFSLRVAVGGNCTLTLIENPTINDSGTELTVFNRNRGNPGYTDYDESHIFRDPTVAAGGQNIHESFIPGGTGIASVGGSEVFGAGWVWDDRSDHVIRLTNVSGGAIYASMHMVGHSRRPL